MNIPNININININNQAIPNVDSQIHLGVKFSSKGKWNTHFDNIIKSVMSHINVMRKHIYKICVNT